MTLRDTLTFAYRSLAGYRTRIEPPLGVSAIMLPSRSTAAMCVVPSACCGAPAGVPCARAAGAAAP